MNVLQFIDSRKQDWGKLDALVRNMRNGDRLSQVDFRQLTLLYRSATSDFAFAETHFSGHDVTRYLNKLVASCHGLIYQQPRVKPKIFGIWFGKQVPGIFWENRKVFLFSLSLFFSFGLVGFLGSEFVPEGEKVFLNFSILNPEGAFNSNSNYIYNTNEHIEAGRPFAVYESDDSFLSSGFIFTNNILVAMYCFVGGILAGLITFWTLATTGMMVGAFYHIFYRHSLSFDFWNTVLLHGMVELSMIIVAATCGFMVGGAMLFPRHKNRVQALKEKGTQAVQIGIVLAFWLVLAGIFEGYVTGARLPWEGKIILNFITLLCLLMYWGVLGYFAHKQKQSPPLLSKSNSQIPNFQQHFNEKNSELAGK